MGLLRDGVASGRLSHQTFVRRLDLALAARSTDQLMELLADLPRSSDQEPLRVRAPVGWRSIAGQVRDAWVALRLPSLVLPRVDRQVFTIGRATECDLQVADLTVSRRHAMLCRVGAEWVLIDLVSTNGSRVNGWRVGSGMVVRPGDTGRFGRCAFRLAEAD